MRDALKGYLALATGLSEVTRQRAVAAAKQLVTQGEATAEQVQSLADDLITASKSNRAAVTTLVRYEVERAMASLGVARSSEVETLQARIRSLETELTRARTELARHQDSDGRPAGTQPEASATKTAKAAPARKTAKTAKTSKTAKTARKASARRTSPGA